MKKILIAAFLFPFFLSQVSAATYKIDPSHSSVSFKIAHLAISKVYGRFDKFSGTIEYVPGNTKAWKTEAVIETASINTNEENRDKHLRSADFFNVEKFPAMTFKSTGVSGVKGLKGKLHGELTLLGVTKPVTLDVEGSGPVTDPWGNERMAAVARGTINRKDFGMVWNKVLDNGGLLAGEKVEITLEIECIKQTPEQPK